MLQYIYTLTTDKISLFCLWVLLLVLLIIPSEVLGGNFAFRKYQVNHGLSENTVMCILQDYHGFVWFGTKDGLNRFDGREFKIYRYDPTNKKSLGNNFIRSLYQHTDSIIWIGTDDGLYFYNPHNDAFTKFDKVTSDQESIQSAVNTVCWDGNNSIWFGTMNQGVFRYNLATDEFSRYSASDDRNDLKSNVVWHIFKDMSGTIWVGTRNGLSRYNNESGSFYTYNRTSQPGDLINAEILTIFEDSDGDLWVGTWSGGLSKLNRSTDTFRTWFTGEKTPHISHVRAFFEYEKNQLLIGSDDGLYLFNKITEDYRRIDDPNDHNSLSDQNVYAITKDTEGGLWLGTYFGGVNYVSSLSKNIEHYYPSHAPYSMSGKAVSQFCEDPSGNLWIATEDGGLNFFDRTSKKFTVFLPDIPGKSISYHNIHSLVLDGDNLWIGTFSRGIDVYNLKTKTFKSYRHSEDENTIDDDCIFSLYKNKKGEILVGTPYGLSKYIHEKDAFQRIPEVRSFVSAMREDHLGNFWVASSGSGIYKYNPTDDTWKNFRHDPESPRSIGFNKVIEIYLDNQHRLWFGTEGRGLYRYHYETMDFSGITEINGLPNNTIYSVLDDKFGNIWVSTNKGLAKFNPNTLQVKTYTQSDGLQSDQFNYRSGFKSSDGLFFFGGVNGFNVFNPDNIRVNDHVPPVVITNIELMDIDTPSEYDSILLDDFRKRKKITLKHNEASIRISFVSLSYLAPDRNQYVYTMDNYNNQWINATGVTDATYINLPPGKYVFRVKGSNNDGIWNEQGDYLEIEVLPPFWKTIYAYAIYFAFLVLLMYFTFQYYYKLAREKQRKRLEQFQKEKEKEVYNSKINFFTSIAHEIRTPVSLIKAPLECIINSEDCTTKETIENLKVIERNTERLIQLINQLLDFRKIEENLYKLNLTQININQLVAEVCYRFKPTAEKININMNASIPEQIIMANVDREAITKIISNLLSNAIKFTKTYINITFSVGETGDFFKIVVADDGQGIEEQYRERVFEPFYQIEPAKLSEKKAGTGIGLALTRQLVERQKGKIYIESEEGCQGCRFVVEIPIAVEVDQGDFSIMDEGSIAENAEAAEDPKSSKLTLLVVEDNKDLLDFMKKNLKSEFNILMAENGKDALEILEKKSVEVIVSDVMMPVMDGVEFVNLVKQDEQFCHIPIILLSARTNNEVKIEGLESGADCYMEKPFSIEFLKAQIHSLIKNRVVLQEKFANSPFISFGSIASNKKDEEFIYKLNKEIEENLTDSEYSIEKLSQSLSLSRSNLQRKLKGLTGMPPNDYIRVFRLKKAAILLQTSNYRINEICYLVGFNNPSYFSKCFQKQFGLLPKEFVNNVNGLREHPLDHQ